MRRVFAYLIKHRSIARDVVAHFAKAGLLYEDSEYHNAVFVGTDTDGVDHTQRNYRQKQACFTGLANLTIIVPSKWLAGVVKQSFLKEYPVEV